MKNPPVNENTIGFKISEQSPNLYLVKNRNRFKIENQELKSRTFQHVYFLTFVI